ncbi:siphovirus ReqiPepy6 Gp37-like family protein [Caldifermentibacillus hisashii]|uniref:siphovirus ReqiPepy6 Gp37-like family protein n=1 Tax=Caldifermentibacillus hisashii TaxID=996558 RepID=UPI0031FD0481
MSKKPIRVITQDFQLLTEIDSYSSLQVVRRWHGIGELELRINRYMKDTHLLQRGVLLIVGGQLHKVYMIKHKEIELDENGKATENWLIKAPALKSVLGQRITVPPSHTAYDNKQGTAEEVMKHYVKNNAVNPVDVNRIIPNLVIADDLNRGNNLSWRSRYKNLAEELEEQSLASGLGWNVYLDIQAKKWVFDVLEGRNLTASQSDLPPVIFGPQFDSLKTLNYSESELNYRNTAYVAGQGEGVDRRVIELGDSTGIDRHELFVDARDVSEETEGENPQPRPEQDIINDLTARGNRELEKMVQEKYLEGQILTKSPFIYEKDYDLGDIVSIQNKDWGVTMDARITEIKEIYEANGFQLEAVFGNDRPTLIDKIKQGFKQYENELKR